MEDKRREEVEEAEHGRNEAPADPTATGAATGSAKDGIGIGWGTMDPAAELVALTLTGGGGRDRRRKAVAEVAEPSQKGDSDGKNPSASITGGFLRYGAHCSVEEYGGSGFRHYYYALREKGGFQRKRQPEESSMVVNCSRLSPLRCR